MRLPSFLLDKTKKKEYNKKTGRSVFREGGSKMSKKYDSEKSIQTILDVSTKLFLEKGFDKTSMQDIANEAKMSKGAIYHHFKSKEEIVNLVIDLQCKRIDQDLEGWLNEMQGFSAKDKLISILENNLADQEAHFLAKALKSVIKSPDYIVSYMQTCVNRSAPVFSQIMKEGNKDGSIETEYPDECAEVFFLLINIWCDPYIFECTPGRLLKRLRFLQHMMKVMGVDIVSDDLILKINEFLNKFYDKESEF